VPWMLDRLGTTWLAGRLHSRDGCDCGQVKRMEGERGLGATRRSASTSQQEKWQRGKNGVVVRRLKGSCVDDGRLAGRARLGSRRRGHPLLLRNPQMRQERPAVSTNSPLLLLGSAPPQYLVFRIRPTSHTPFAGLPSIASRCIAMPNASRQTLVPPLLLFAHLRNSQHTIFGLVVKARAPASLAPLQ